MMRLVTVSSGSEMFAVVFVLSAGLKSVHTTLKLLNFKTVGDQMLHTVLLE